MLKKPLWLPILATLAILAGCAQNNGPFAPATLVPAQGGVALALSIENDTAVTGIVTLSQDDVTYTQTFTIKNNSASVTFSEIPAGDWNVEVQLFDASGTLINTSTSQVVVRKQETASVKIHINPATGEVTVKVKPPVKGKEEKIVFLSSGVITFINPDGTGLTPLPGNPHGYEPNNYPGGQELAVFHQDSSVWLVNYLTGAKSGIPGVRARAVRWNRSGTRLAGHTPNADGIVVFNPDGSGVQVITPAGIHAVSPVWTADGRILYGGTESEGNQATPHAIYIIDADGGNRTRLTDFYAYIYPTDCTLAGDVLFTQLATDRARIGRLDLNTRIITIITDNPGWSDNSGGFNSDGSKIVFQSNRIDGYTPQTYLMNRDGSNQTRLSQSLTYDEGPYFIK